MTPPLGWWYIRLMSGKIIEFPDPKKERVSYVDGYMVGLEGLVESAAVDGDIMLRLGESEAWFTVEEFMELLQVWGDVLLDAAHQRTGNK